MARRSGLGRRGQAQIEQNLADPDVVAAATWQRPATPDWQTPRSQQRTEVSPDQDNVGMRRYRRAPVLISGDDRGRDVSSPGGPDYRRAPITATDDDGFSWLIPSATMWPDVKGNPPGPRTQMIGYNLETRTVRTVFRDGTPWRYDDVSPQEWERMRRTSSTGKMINRVLNNHPYGRDDSFTPPTSPVFYPR